MWPLLTPYLKLRVEGNPIALYEDSKIVIVGETTWELTLFGSKSDKMKFGPY